MASHPSEMSGPYYSTLPRDLETRLPPGTTVCGGRVEVVEEIARGGMAVVYRAVDFDAGRREVALKIATADASSHNTIARFENEARLGALMGQHPLIVRPLQVGQLEGPEGFEGRNYLITELVEGRSLDVLMSRSASGLEVSHACRIGRDVARALVHLHAQGIVHRDVKPGNVLVEASASPGMPRVRLIDFGLAYATGDGWLSQSPDLTAEGVAPGTPLYMSPQQAAHARPTPAFDVYSLGVMLYELLSGKPPYDGLHHGEMLARKCDPERRPFPIERIRSGLPASLTMLIDRCMQFEPGARPQATEVVAVLDELIDDTETATSSSPEPEEPPDPAPAVVAPRARSRWLAVATASTALGLVGWLVWPAMMGTSEASIGVRGDAAVLVSPPASDDTATPAATHSPSLPASDDDSAEATPNATATGPTLEPAPATPTTPPEPAVLEPQPAPRTKPTTADRCTGQVEQARDAARANQWSQVLQLTKRARCFVGDARAERVKLRVQALYETRRDEECVELGGDSRDADVRRWAGICAARRAKEGSP